MEVMYPRCAGLDLAKDSLVACVRIHGRPVHQESRTFGMTTRELLALLAWLAEHGVTHVAMGRLVMESRVVSAGRGVYAHHGERRAHSQRARAQK